MFNALYSRTNLFVLVLYQFILVYFFNEMIYFLFIFSIFLNLSSHVSYSHIYRIIIYFKLNQELLISQLILNLFFYLSSFSHLLQITERTVFFKKTYDILGYLNFLYLLQITHEIFFILIFLVIENILVVILSLFSYLLR